MIDTMDPTPVQERDLRIRALLRELATYTHGKDGTHYHHSLTDRDHAEVLAVLALFGEYPEQEGQ